MARPRCRVAHEMSGPFPSRLCCPQPEMVPAGRRLAVDGLPTPAHPCGRVSHRGRVPSVAPCRRTGGTAPTMKGAKDGAGLHAGTINRLPDKPFTSARTYEQPASARSCPGRRMRCSPGTSAILSASGILTAETGKRGAGRLDVGPAVPALHAFVTFAHAARSVGKSSGRSRAQHVFRRG